MASDGATVERLRQFLGELGPNSRALLIAEFERSLLRGEDNAAADLVLRELRSLMRESDRPPPRIGNSARLFFRPLEPFLVDDVADHKHPGRIARASLEPMWTWIRRDLLPDEAKEYSDEVSKALLDNDKAKAEALTVAFQDKVAGRIESAFTAAKAEEKARRRLIAQIGTPRASEDVSGLLTVLKARDALDDLAKRLPGHIQNLNDATLDNTKALVDAAANYDPEVLLYALLVVMSRLAAPWQLTRLAVKAADSDVAARVADTPYAVAVTIVLAEVERLVGELRIDLKSGRGVAVTTLLKLIHDAARGLRTEMDLSVDSVWSRSLAALRTQISELLKSEIESTPGRVRRLLRPRPSKEIRPGSVLDLGDIAEVEGLIEFVGACRNFAGELAISEMTQRTFSELQQYLDVTSQALLDGLRHAGEGDRTFRQSQVDASVRFCAKAFGKEYASSLSKASGVAAASERKAAKG